MSDKEILGNAPEGATHYDNGEYLKAENLWWFGFIPNVGWDESRPERPTRSLADIRTIIEQAEENQALKARVVELENHKNYYQDFLKENTDCESITELVGKYKKQSQCIAELELTIKVQQGELDDFRGIENTGSLNVKQELEILKLEQQAKGCTDLIGMWKAMKSQHLTIADLQRRSEYLLEQAKQIKGQEHE